MDFLLRVGLFLVFGVILLLADVWFVRTAYDSFSRGDFKIAPFEVIGSSDGGSVNGKMLAYLLQIRLQQVQTDLRRAEDNLKQPLARPRSSNGPPEPPQSDRNDKLPPPMPDLFPEPINLRGSLFSPVELKAEVGGVEVGWLVPWLQRTVLNPKMVTYTVSYEKGKTIVAGDIGALDADAAIVWTETTATAPGKIADLVAHQMILSKLSTNPRSSFRALDVEEFQIFSSTLVGSAKLKADLAQGRPGVRKGYADLLPGVEGLVDKVPDWSELLFFAGDIAESAGARDQELKLYSRYSDLLGPSTGQSNKDDRNRLALVESKLEKLRIFTGLGPQIVNVTGGFEFGSGPEKIFGTVSSFDSDDLRFGVASWSFSTGTLGPLLREFQDTDPVLFAKLLGDGASEIQPLLTGDQEGGLAFVRQVVDKDGKIQGSWRSRFEALGREPNFQKVQMRTLEPWFTRAIAIADANGLCSARGLTLSFDILFHQGNVLERNRGNISSQIDAFQRENSREPDELERIGIIVNAVSEAIPLSLRDDARRRYLTIASGDLPRSDRTKKALALVNFRTGEPVKLHAGAKAHEGS